MRLRCECGREFSPLAEEDCPSCGATERFQHIQGWVELKCPCGHVAWREEDAPDNMQCPACRRELKRPPDAPIYPERPDPAPWVERNRQSLPDEILVAAVGWILVLRGASIATECAIEIASASTWGRSGRIERCIPSFLLALLLATYGVRLIRRMAGSRWTTLVLTCLWVWYALAARLNVMVPLGRVSGWSDEPALWPIAALIPDAFVLGAILSKDWTRGTYGLGAAGPLASILSAPRVGGVGAWLGLISVFIAIIGFAATALRFLSV